MKVTDNKEEYEARSLATHRKFAAIALNALEASGMSCNEVDDKMGMPHGSFKKWINRLMDGHTTYLSTICMYLFVMGCELQPQVFKFTLSEKGNSNV